MGYFEYNGKKSSDFGIEIERYPYIPSGARLFEAVQVPGRSGTLTLDTGAFSNYTQSYEVYYNTQKLTPKMNAGYWAQRIRGWLALDAGYHRLIDSYDAQTFRFARYVGGDEIESIRNRYGRFTVNFDCAPQRYFVSSYDEPEEITATAALMNPYFPSHPLLRIKLSSGQTSGTITIGGYTIEITGAQTAAGRKLVIDCETGVAYYSDTPTISRLSLLKVTNTVTGFNEFPILPHVDEPGTIAVDSGGFSIDFYSRLWTL